MTEVPFIEQVKHQAAVLVPVVRKLQEELGDDKARALIREALAPYARDLGRRISSMSEGTGLQKIAAAGPLFAAGDALDIEPVEQSETTFAMNIRGCRYAEFFRRIGAQDLGELLVCNLDFPMTEGLGDDIRLERSQTIMGGSSHCDFRWSAV